jgi:tripeptide aminopeptidase
MVEPVADRVLRDVKIDTQSQGDVEEVPSSIKQFDLAKMLMEELQEMGLSDAEVDKHCYVYATLPASPGYEAVKTIGFIAHMDTSPESPGKVTPMVWKDYDGGDIRLPEEGLVISPEENPELANYKGQDIITSDGSSLLGADDKAGVAEIMCAVETMLNDPAIKHGRIRIAFTPDEEVGKGTDFFDVEAFGCEFAYTMDGSALGEIENETFTASTATLTFKGYNVHPGYAFGKMKNSLRAAAGFLDLLPKDTAPETTDDKEGYLHPMHFDGDVERSVIKVLIRDFEAEGILEKKEMLKALRDEVDGEFEGIDVGLDIKDSYENMKTVLDKHPHVLEIAQTACERAGLSPRLKHIRGGTDGARLCFMGLPTPNIFAGGINFHSKKEFVPIPSMEKAVQVIIEIAKLVAEQG